MCTILLALLACHVDPAVSSPTGDDGGSDSGSASATDGGADDGGADDGGADDGGADDDCGLSWTSDLSACSGLAPFDQVGTTWTYAGDAVTKESLSRTAAGAVEYCGDDAWQIDEHEEGASDDSWIVQDRTLLYRCDTDGVWLIGGTATYEDHYADGEVDTTTTSLHYTAPALVVPAEVEVGTTWTSDWAYDWERDDGESGSRSYTMEHEVVDLVSVTVPAGTWDAWEVQRTGGDPLDLVEGIGAVIDGDFELTAVEP